MFRTNQLVICPSVVLHRVQGASLAPSLAPGPLSFHDILRLSFIGVIVTFHSPCFNFGVLRGFIGVVVPFHAPSFHLGVLRGFIGVVAKLLQPGWLSMYFSLFGRFGATAYQVGCDPCFWYQRRALSERKISYSLRSVSSLASIVVLY